MDVQGDVIKPTTGETITKQILLHSFPHHTYSAMQPKLGANLSPKFLLSRVFQMCCEFREVPTWEGSAERTDDLSSDLSAEWWLSDMHAQAHQHSSAALCLMDIDHIQLLTITCAIFPR